jgi:hypothetical protein
MYDLFTTAYLFFVLCPGVLVTIPPGSSILMSAAIHAILFFLILQYLSLYIPWYVIWIVGIASVSSKVYFGRAVPV